MPKAEVGSTKYLNNKLKSKGLQRLRWYCQVCERQMRDENGFKMHCQTEGHVRQMDLVSANSQKFISDYSAQFQNDFVKLLRTAHGEKKVNINHFYQEYISDKEHIHMNATRWPSLTEFGKHLGRTSVCRVEEGERGLEVAWIDNSPEALRRQDAIRKKERQDRGDEEREQRLIKEQIKRARRDAEEREMEAIDEDEEHRNGEEDDKKRPGTAKDLQREEGKTITLNFGAKAASQTSASQTPVNAPPPAQDDVVAEKEKPPPPAIFCAPNNPSKPKNVFAAAKKKMNVLLQGGMKPTQQQRPMSEAERIMKEEIERNSKKRAREAPGALPQGPPGAKRIRTIMNP